MAEYKYVKKFVILEELLFWWNVWLVFIGLACLVGFFYALTDIKVSGWSTVFLGIIGLFNTFNGFFKLFPNDDKDKLYEIKRKRIKLTEAEKLLGD